jgi:hypothetical protein
MIQILNLFFYYFLIIFSAIGYGMLACNNFKLKKKVDFGFIGLTGVLILICFSYYSNLFFKHDYLHNSIVILVGFSIFNFFIIKNFKDLKKNFQLTVIVFSILFIGLLMYKNHDDFFYYHFQYSLSLINFKKIFGLGLLEHGYRTPSSLFYLNSLFYLPGIKLHLINSGAVLIFGFSNIFILNRLFIYLKKKKHDFIFFLLLLTFIYINTTFYRIAEHGTDRSSLILIFIFSIIYLESLNIKNLKSKIVLEDYYEKIMIFIALIVSFKSFYLLYFLFIIAWFYETKNLWLNKNYNRIIINNKFTYLSFFTFFAVLFTIFSNTGCLVYPASFTCFTNLEWSIPIDEVQKMKGWYELWSKGGANPNFRVDNPVMYLQNLNWVSNWFSSYFFTKVSDFLFVITLISFVVIFYLKTSKISKIKNNFIKFKFFYFLLIIFALEWFINHPALRYGGYTLFVLILFIPVSLYLNKYQYDFVNLKKKVSILLIITLVIFVGKNFNRIFKEIEQYGYDPLINPYFYINKKGFEFDNFLKRVEKHILPIKKNNYLILNQKIINEVNKKK